MNTSESLLIKGKENSTLKLREIVKILGIDNKREHLTEDEFKSFLVLYSSNRTIAPYKYCYKFLETYKLTVKMYKNLDEWENASPNEKIPKRKSTPKVLYYYAMVMCGRINPDWKVLNSYYPVPGILSDEEKKYIKSTALALAYKGTTINHVIKFIEKIIVCTNKDLKKINENDLYSYRNNYYRSEYAKATLDRKSVV